MGGAETAFLRGLGGGGGVRLLLATPVEDLLGGGGGMPGCYWPLLQRVECAPALGGVTGADAFAAPLTGIDSVSVQHVVELWHEQLLQP